MVGADSMSSARIYFSQSFIEQSTLTEETITQRIATMREFKRLEEAQSVR